MKPIAIGKSAGSIAVKLDSLRDGAIVLIGGKARASSLTPNTRSLLP